MSTYTHLADSMVDLQMLISIYLCTIMICNGGQSLAVIIFFRDHNYGEISMHSEGYIVNHKPYE